jgi:hypothetical protein
MRQIWTGRVAQAGGRYGEHAPMAAVCCNACRTCVMTNLLGLVTAAFAGAGYAIARLARRRQPRLGRDLDSSLLGRRLYALAERRKRVVRRGELVDREAEAHRH